MKTAAELIEEQGFENLVVEKLLNIEGRMSTLETTMTWFKYIGRGSIIVISGFFGFDVIGVI